MLTLLCQIWLASPQSVMEGKGLLGKSWNSLVEFSSKTWNKGGWWWIKVQLERRVTPVCCNNWLVFPYSKSHADFCDCIIRHNFEESYVRIVGGYMLPFDFLPRDIPSLCRTLQLSICGFKQIDHAVTPLVQSVVYLPNLVGQYKYGSVQPLAMPHIQWNLLMGIGKPVIPALIDTNVIANHHKVLCQDLHRSSGYVIVSSP